MRIAVIGAGNWGVNLVRTLGKLGVLKGVVESHSESRARLTADFPEQPVHADYQELLSAEIDAVAIATPAGTHHEIAKAFLENGKDVFVEKPLTLTSGDAQDLVTTAEEHGRILMVGHLLLHQPAVRWIKDYLDSGSLGKVFSLHQERMKLGRARAVENVLWSLGVHDVAVLLYLAGTTPVDVRFSGHAGLQSGIEDDVYLHLGFENGVKAHLHSSWLWPENRRRLTVIGERGMLLYDEVKQSVVLHKKTIDAALQNQDGGETVVFEADGQPLQLEMEHFIDCIARRKTPLSCGRNGLEVVKVLEQAAG